MLRYLRSVQGGAREAASTTERLVQVEASKTLTHSSPVQSSHLSLLHFPICCFYPPCNALRRWFRSCTSAWKLTTTRGSSDSRSSQPRFLSAEDSQSLKEKDFSESMIQLFKDEVSAYCQLLRYPLSSYAKLCKIEKNNETKIEIYVLSKSLPTA